MLKREDYQTFVTEAALYLKEIDPTINLIVEGSFASNKLIPGISDLDLHLVTQDGKGPGLRDELPTCLANLGDLLTVFVDPYSEIGSYCSIYRGPLKVDWFVSEEVDGKRQRVWRGNEPPVYDDDGHPWDWIWWMWSKFKAGKFELTREVLAKLWLFLTLKGVDPQRFPSSYPSAEPVALEQQIIETLATLPAQEGDLAAEIRNAINLTSTKSG